MEIAATDLTYVEELLEEANLKLEDIELHQEDQIESLNTLVEGMQLLNCFIVFFIIIILLKYAYKFLDIFF